MAVEDKYANSTVEAGGIVAAALVSGAKTVTVISTVEIAAANDDGSVFRMFKGLDSSLIPVSLLLFCDALTGATDIDVGLYKTEKGIVADKDILADGLDISSGSSTGINALPAVDVANRVKRLYELLGKTTDTKAPRYDICVTANTIGSGAGTLTMIGTFLQG